MTRPTCWNSSEVERPPATAPSLNRAPTPESSPQRKTYFYQGRGFTVAESYYQSLLVPYQGLMVGEPLAAPFAKSGRRRVGNLVTNGVLSSVRAPRCRVSASQHRRASFSNGGPVRETANFTRP
jgi:hypothetical protein